MRWIGGVIDAFLPRGRWRLPGNVLRRVLRVEHVLVQNKPDNRVVGKRWPTLGTGEWPRGRQEVADPGHRRRAAWSARGGRPWVPAQSPPEREALRLANVVDLGQDRLLVPAVEEGRAHPVSGQLGDRGRG